MSILLIVLSAIALTAVGSTLVQIVRDGYGRVADRPDLYRQTARDDLLKRGFTLDQVR